MNDTIQKIRDFIRENSNGDPEKFISFLSSLFGDGGSDTPNENLSILKSKAEDGDPEIQYCLGFCYENGIGVPEDKAEAVNWFRKAAEQGYAKAQFYLGVCYACGEGVSEDKAEAVKWFRKAAEQEDAEVQYMLGFCYECGVGVPEDKAEAVNWFRKAAEQGYAPAQNNLGYCYKKGEGVPEDKVKAVNWYLKAAEQGYAPAQDNLGDCYFNGEGVPEDKEKAVNWYLKAAEQGYTPAQNSLGFCYKKGEGVPEDKAEAVNWFRKAAEQGYTPSQDNLGDCHFYGEGVPEDKAEAVYWYRKAAEQGYRPAQNSLGYCYFHGEGVPEDKEKAVNWFRKAAEQGYAPAQYILGFCYRQGKGVPEDKAEAANWYRKAAEQGYARAQWQLGECYASGEGVPEDKAEAVKWLFKAVGQGYEPYYFEIDSLGELGNKVEEEIAIMHRRKADQGDAEAQYHLGKCYAYGKGVPEDKAEAVNWYRKAAEQGDTDAKWQLGKCYAEGEGVPEDKAEAVKWLCKAVEQGYDPRPIFDSDLIDSLGELGDKVKEEVVNLYRRRAEQGDTRAQRQLGEWYAYGKGVPEDKVEAVNWYRKAAEQGDTDAQWQLGECYAKGEGVPEDKAEAVKWLCKAVRQGCEPLLIVISGKLIDSLGELGNEVKEEVAKMYRRKAEHGDADAQWRLGECYAKGNGVPEDKAEAVNWYRKAADQGDARAQWDLGECYARGTGVPEDKTEAVKWLCKAVGQDYTPFFSFDSDLIDSLGELGNKVKEEVVNLYRRKAEQGNTQAQYDLACCYYNGDGVPEDKEKAAQCYLKAAEQGYDEAQYILARCYEYGDGIPEDKTEAANWYRKAADQGHAEAQYSLGVCYYKGDGVPEDKTEAANWYRKAAEQGDGDAQWQLGKCYANGEGVPEDKEEAANWFRKATDQDADLQWRLGTCYANGVGVPEDKAEAVKWLCKAVGQGYDPYSSLHSVFDSAFGSEFDSKLIDSLGELGNEVKEEVAKVCRRKADQGDANAQWRLGECYANGKGVPEDKAEAVKWLCRAVGQGYDPYSSLHSEFVRELIDSLGELGNKVKEEVVNLYRRKAEQGADWSQWRLGECYARGEDVPEDKKEAVKWLCKAVGQGYDPYSFFASESDSELIDSLGELGNEVKEEIAKLYRRKAEQGVPMAQWRLGECYANGTGVPEDRAEAVKWLCKAIRQDYEPHIYSDLIDSLGELGNEVKEEIAKLYRRKAEQGVPMAQWRLGECYAKGEGIPEDKAEAVKWLCKAVEQGYDPFFLLDSELPFFLLDSELIDFLGELGNEVKEEVVTMYRKKVEQGDVDAQWQLGRCYANGVGVPEDKAEAVKWLCKAVEQGYDPSPIFDSDLIDSLGELGNEVKEEIAKMYRRKAEHGDAWAQYNLGDCYEEGTGVPKDKAEAVNWYRKAAEQGHKKATEALKRLSE